MAGANHLRAISAWGAAILVALSLVLHGQGDARISKTGLIASLEKNALSMEELAALVRTRGLSFTMNAQHEADLKRAGAKSPLLEAVWDHDLIPGGERLSISDVVDMITLKIPQPRIERFVNIRGASAEDGTDIDVVLNRAGAQPSLLAAVKAHVTLTPRLGAPAASPTGAPVVKPAAYPSDQWTPQLLAASLNGKVADIELLFAAGASPNGRDAQGQTAVMVAASKGRTNAIRSLLAHRAEVDAKRDDNATALLLAAAGNYDETAIELIHAGADVNAVATTGEGALMYAARRGNSALVKALLASNVLVDAKDSQGATPLMLASQEGKTDVVKLLVAAKADVNAKTAKGDTALMLAACNNRKDAVVALVAAGSNLDAKNVSSQSPLTCATSRGHMDLGRELLKLGATPAAAQ